MCRALEHSFEVTKDYVLRGLQSRELALYAVGRRHLDEDDFLEDLLSWERMYSLHEPTVNNLKVNVQSSGKGASFRRPRDGRAIVTDGLQLKEKVGTAVALPDDPRGLKRPVSCWACRKTGHLSRDCPEKQKRKTVCFGCEVEGHIRPNCPDRNQTSIAVVSRETISHPYRRTGSINDCKVDILLDTGSHHTLIKASIAVRCGIPTKPAS
jgi:hypothetical protein